MTLADTKVGDTVTIQSVAGSGSFRRRLLELGVLPGTHVMVVGIAPFNDPLELWVRGGGLSIRRAEATQVAVCVTSQSEVRLPAAQPSVLPQLWVEDA